MVSARRWIIALLAVGLVMTGAAAAWIYYGTGLLPKKGPVRARQVITSQAPFVSGDRAAPYGEGEKTNWHKYRDFGQTID